MKTHSSELHPRGAFKMKALTLAAVIALSATGAAAWEATNDVLTKGIKITEFDSKVDGNPRKEMLYLYNGYVFYCVADLRPQVACLTNLPMKLAN
jgi:hypothetical protein